MRDTRTIRTIIVIAGTAAIGAVIGEMYLRPALERMAGKR